MVILERIRISLQKKNKKKKDSKKRCLSKECYFWWDIRKESKTIKEGKEKDAKRLIKSIGMLKQRKR